MQLAVTRPNLAPPAPPAPPPAAAAAGGAENPSAWQPPRWAPPLGAITYAKETATAVLLLLALPYVLFKLLTAPGQLLKAAGRRHVQPS